jgi:hypothetical protein
MKPGRVPGSCRFEPYYKAEVWDPKMMTWRVIQKSCASEAAARGLVSSGRGRVVTVTEKGKTFSEPFEVGAPK